MPEYTENSVSLLGRLTADPEVRSLNSGDKVATFSVATKDTWKDRDGKLQERSQFHPVMVWNQALVEATVPHLKKGARVQIKGALEHRSYESNGSTRYVTEVVLRFNGSIGMLGAAPSRPVDESTAPRQASARETYRPR